ncbi:MAG: hypothetical protein ACI8RZ_002076 [Myxococcota bacterium]|jgi:hypothetical protein
MVLLLAACTQPTPSQPSDIADTATPTAPIHGPGLTQGGVVTCADPSLRKSEGAMLVGDLGDDWASQTPADFSDDLSRGAGLVVADLNSDGLDDVFLPNFSPCQLFLSQPDGTLADASPDSLPDYDRKCDAWAASAADVDGDGDLDLFLARDSQPDQLFLNDGTGTFTNVSSGSGLGGGVGSRSGSWGDLDGDGDLDLFVARHHTVSIPAEASVEDNALFLSQGDGTFDNITDQLPEAAVSGYTFLGSWLDIDGDADQDLYIINDFGYQLQPNVLLTNDGGTLTADTDDESGLGLAIEAMGLGVGDLNDDGLPDMMITDRDALHLMLSSGDFWYDAAVSQGLIPSEEQYAAWGVALADMDNDGDLDAPMVYGPPEEGAFTDQPDALWVQAEGGTFTDEAESWGLAQTTSGRGLVVADLNDDGWLDLIKTDYLGGPASAHLSRCGSEGWLVVRLEGSGANTFGIGARITVTAGDATWTRWLSAGSISLGVSGPPEVHLGLGIRDTVDTLTIHWPGGGQTTYTELETRQVLTVSQEAADISR